MLTINSPAVVAAARALCKKESAECNVHPSDSWVISADAYKEDALAALQAAGVPDLVAACEAFSKLYGRLWDTTDGGGMLSPDSVKQYDELHEQMSKVLAKFSGG